MPWIDLLLALCAFWGHFALCMFAFNRVHATSWPRLIIKLWALGLFLFGLVTAIYFAWQAFGRGAFFLNVPSGTDFPAWQRSYIVASLASAALLVPVWLVPWLLRRAPRSCEVTSSGVHDIKRAVGSSPVHGREGKWASRIPFNQIFELEVNEKTLLSPSLPEALHGVTIAHLSDLHFAGELTRPFYEQVVEQTNQLAADIVVISGDIVEHLPSLEWFAVVIGKLQAPLGRWSILGNHDLKLGDPADIRRRLSEAGFLDVGQSAHTVELRGVPVLLCGNEAPWFPRVPDRLVEEAGARKQPQYRILVSHTPDQIGWARRHRFDLMLSGHVHGGQVKLPWLGPIFCPSLYGRIFSEGMFYREPTLLHVSRGVAGKDLLRWNCRPEVTKLTLLSK